MGKENTTPMDAILQEKKRAGLVICRKFRYDKKNCIFYRNKGINCEKGHFA